jgi:EAL domain-containing protein (putative c-di-GMP-specific phosphodiesterase class I)
MIRLEITEEAMADDNFLLSQMEAVREKGFDFVLDDYGTGYSNLTRLKGCPFINVKLDMSLVWAYCKQPDGILPSMIPAFHNMGFTITAEGIEDSEKAEKMISIGCDYLQGYAYSKPVPMEELLEKFKK